MADGRQYKATRLGLKIDILTLDIRKNSLDVHFVVISIGRRENNNITYWANFT